MTQFIQTYVGESGRAWDVIAMKDVTNGIRIGTNSRVDGLNRYTLQARGTIPSQRHFAVGDYKFTDLEVADFHLGMGVAVGISAVDLKCYYAAINPRDYLLGETLIPGQSAVLFGVTATGTTWGRSVLGVWELPSHLNVEENGEEWRLRLELDNTVTRLLINQELVGQMTVAARTGRGGLVKAVYANTIGYEIDNFAEGNLV